MKLYSLSDNPNKPCSVLKFKNTTIMFDCGLDATSVLAFLPLPLVLSTRLSNLPVWTPRDSGDAQLEGEFKEANGRVFVDSAPEFCTPETGLVDFADIDVILVSNYQSMLALPFITEGTGFKGTVYMTEPTLLIGRLFMEELVNYIERTPKPRTATKWKQQAVKFLQLPASDHGKPRSWKQLYSMQEVNSSLSKVKVVGFNEKLDVFGMVQVSAVSSGYCLGSCNWIACGDQEKMVYMAGSSTLTTHPKPMEHSCLRGADVLLLTSLTQTPLANPDAMLGDFCITVAMTVKVGGNVLVPCYPSGVTYDLFECLSGHLETTGQSNVPMYFLSPVADNSLAYSSILAEWLSSAKQAKVYLPEEPFPHAQLVRGGRLKPFTSLKAEGFTSDFHTPCIVFAGHPSLRFGDVVHFMELWGSSPNNVVIFTEPDFNHIEALAPFQPLAMRTVYVPIDTSLSFSQANKLVRDLKPTNLVMPAQYTQPPLLQPHRNDLVIEAECEVQTYARGSIVHIPVHRKYQRIDMVSELASSIVPIEVKRGLGVATLTGSLFISNNRCILKPPPKETSSGKQWNGHAYSKVYTFGNLDVTELTRKLEKAGYNDIKVENTASGVIVHLPNEDTIIQIDEHSTHVFCEGDYAVRAELRDLLLQCLSKF
ncbi:integrator complex subunit 9-like [Ornithodoros turicata]|uniref:Putative cleavage and polyadenylation specificity factor cpsf subunit n=1 Tax=Ornithodoros turicata TaxID=34597 RepID=A0A2R5L9D6_9ACAR